MNNQSITSSFSAKQKGLFILSIWGLITLLLLRQDLYGLDEFAARILLQAWSMADQVASSAVIAFGFPDLRIVPFLPLAFLWSSKVFAAKVFSALLMAVAAWFLHCWSQRTTSSIAALVATGLLLVSPATLSQLDSISSGVYLLAAFALTGWLDQRFRMNPRAFNGWFFALLFAAAFATSLHPAGLAVPILLLLSTSSLPMSAKLQRFFSGGIIFVTAFILLLRKGWSDLPFFPNPVHSLSSPFAAGSANDSTLQWLPGVILLALLTLVVLLRFRMLLGDLTGRMLLAGVLMGAISADASWGLLAVAAILFGGIPMLLGETTQSQRSGIMGNLALPFLLVMACSFSFMFADKAYYLSSHSGILSPQDELIQALAQSAEKATKEAEADQGIRKHARFIVASQWPGRTMIACKCDTLPLPAATPTPEEQLQKLGSVTYLLFAPGDTANLDLKRNFSALTSQIPTEVLLSGGVILHVLPQDAGNSQEAQKK